MEEFNDMNRIFKLGLVLTSAGILGACSNGDTDDVPVEQQPVEEQVDPNTDTTSDVNTEATDDVDDLDDQNTTGDTTGATDERISESEAQDIAFEAAGVSVDELDYVGEVEFDANDNKYDVEFTSNGVEYEFEIDASTGSVLESEMDNN